ncbi:ligase-associated DNA damage response endonuclease PdeM [Fimbriiglobus ruber]|uniref:ICC-like protein phosphoesterase n=1 Tax=Fimbriiglobus ruber TaxID=1908690 RepID=A0A225DE81_9BACT|nr:ligase-associated DNA damage response endonuclease PdeM [Fimbriiglobus ruber]OWK39850.1 ICC-like protein phosphoesterase [Fimbriiglobus ruber]
MTRFAVCGEVLWLLPERCAFWERTQTLVLADPHFGKPDAFRAAAVPVPGGATGPLDRLDRALETTGATRVVVLGDFWHAREGRTPELVEELDAWRADRPDVRFDLFRGNHDRAGPPPPGWAEVWQTGDVSDGPFVFAHFPEPSDVGYVLAGHLHPAVALTGLGRQRVRLPCFWFGPQVGVFPAFGDFTGTATIRPGEKDRVFVLAEDQVVDITPDPGSGDK